MELNNNNAAVRTDSTNAPAAATSAGEIDLYDEVIAFAALSSEDRLRLLDRPVKVSAQTEMTSAENVTESAIPEPVLIHGAIKPAGSDTTVRDAESVRDSEVSKAYVKPGGVRPPLVEGPRPSGPLSGFNLPPNIVYTGALSQGVCLACGAESGADDLFCMTCGGFIDEIDSTLPFKPTCGKCKQGIAADEIFCPWCGSALPAP